MEEKVGKLFTTNGEDVWRLISYCKYPTLTFENLETKERIGGAVGSLNVKDFKELTIKENKDKKKPIKKFGIGDTVRWHTGYIDTIKKPCKSFKDSWYLSAEYNSCPEKHLTLIKKYLKKKNKSRKNNE